MGLSILFTDTRRDDSPRLPLPVGEVTIVIDDDMACLTGSFGADDAFASDNLSSERSLVLEHIHWDSGLIPVRFCLEEVLLSGNSSAESKEKLM